MRTAIRRWLYARRYRVTLRQLQRLRPGELESLGIPPWEITHLAREAARLWRS